MGAWIRRVTELENITDQTLKLRECAVGDPEGIASDPVMLYKGKSKWIPATKFSRHSNDAVRPRWVKLVSSDPETGAETTVCELDTNNFIHFKKLVFFREETGKMGVRGDRAMGIGFGRIKLVKCLKNLFLFKVR